MSLRTATSAGQGTRTVELSAALVMAVFGGLALGLVGALNTGADGLLTGLIGAVLPVPLYVLLALWIDRFEKEPLSMLGLAFLWGATGAFLFSLILNSLSAEALAVLGGPAAADLGTAVLAAPLIEETSKGLALLFLFLWQRHEFDNVIDGILYATMVGLGFAMMENVSYYGEAGLRGPEASRTAFVVRGVLTPFAHPFFTAMTGIGLGLARETVRPAWRAAAPAAGLAAAIFFHALWNLSTGFGMVFFGAYLLVMVPAFLGVLALVAVSQRRERRIIHAHLLRYRRAGHLDREEVDSLCRPGGRSRALWRALRAGGVAGWRREKRFHDVASELAFHHWRLARGLSLGAEADAGFQAEHLALMRELKGSAKYGVRGAD